MFHVNLKITDIRTLKIQHVTAFVIFIHVKIVPSCGQGAKLQELLPSIVEFTLDRNPQI